MNTLTVLGMKCNHCTKAVMDAVSAVSGVSNVNVNLNTGIVTWEGDEDTKEAVKKAVLGTGFEVK